MIHGLELLVVASVILRVESLGVPGQREFLLHVVSIFLADRENNQRLGNHKIWQT